MPDWLLQILAGAFASGAVTWGVVRTELKYLRRDVDRAHQRIDKHEDVPHERRQEPTKRTPVAVCID